MLICVRKLFKFPFLCYRDKIHHIDNSLVRDSLNILKLERIRCNYLLVHDKVSDVIKMYRKEKKNLSL
jgi:hypothetical protein